MLALSYRPPRMDEGTETTSGTWRHWSLAKLDGVHHRELSESSQVPGLLGHTAATQSSPLPAEWNLQGLDTQNYPFQ